MTGGRFPWALVDVRVLDHFIVAGSGALSFFAERGLL
jgi:DNA repair protein RadC